MSRRSYVPMKYVRKRTQGYRKQRRRWRLERARASDWFERLLSWLFRTVTRCR